MHILDSFDNNLIAEGRYRMILDGLQVTPLTYAQRAELSGLCRQVVEKPTDLGFRVRLVMNGSF